MAENKIIPAVALRGVTILPGVNIHFDITRIRSINAAETALSEGTLLFLVTQRDSAVENPGFADVYSIGTVARVRQITKLPNKIYRIMVEGLGKGELIEFKSIDPFIMAEVADVTESGEVPENAEIEAMKRVLNDLLVSYAQKKPQMNQIIERIRRESEIERLMNEIVLHIPMDYEAKQLFLEASGPRERYEVVSERLITEIKVTDVLDDFHKKVKSNVDKNQRDYILREQMSVIKKELGDSPDPDAESDDYIKKTEKLNAPQSIKDKILREIRRFGMQGMNSAEGGVLRNYIETMLEMPWDNSTEDNIDLDRAAEILDEDHYGLRDVKDRVLEFLAVRKLAQKGGDSPIICLIGPPGTGKTSIAKSVARALGRKYVRICLGGIRDEAEIRGHRKTYVGAMPGRIAAGIKQAGTKNPVMLLDEIDKLGSDYRGDPSSALLEVLDGEQNSHFTDHFIEAPIDLSDVLFIATANDSSTIPRPLLDRMEIIEVTSYTENEKEHIAKEHLIAKQLKANGLDGEHLLITDGAIRGIIEGYTREAGVRGLERTIGSICRKAAKEIACGKQGKITVTENDLTDYLGRVKYPPKKAEDEPLVGAACGLAWTRVGGETLEIEVNVMPGSGKLILTGKLGDVMKESATAGLTYVRSVSEEYEIPEDYFDKHDIHIHIPEGAVPKDGPSAGITMATAMLSAVTGKKVRADVAMTGEITLRGRVLAIGGLKEKMLAAKTAGLTTVIVPEDNETFVDEISDEIKGGMEIIYASTMDTVLKNAFV